jgi:hypothetical protein
MQKVFAMLSEAPSTTTSPSERASFFDDARDEYARVKREAMTATPLVRGFIVLSLVLTVAALVTSIIAHGGLPQTAGADGPLAVTLLTQDGKTTLPVTAPVKLTAQTTNTARRGNVAYTWTFGDGATGNGAVVSHTYASYGYYEVVVTARDAQGQQAVAKTTLNVLPPAPQAVLKATQDRAYSYMLSADGTGSKGAELHFYWDFGDGHVSDSGDDRTISHFYLAAGTYMLTLTVVDVTGQQSVATKQITVKPL